MPHIIISQQPNNIREFPCTFSQERLWFIQEWYGNIPAYHIHTAFKIYGTLEVSKLSWAIQQMIQRHASLRTIFRKQNNLPIQVILRTINLPLQIIDYQNDSIAEAEEKAKITAKNEIRKSFDLINGPLFRILWIKLPKQDIESSIIVLTFHHIISDGWSLSIFLRELLEYYHAILTQRTPQLPELSIQYYDYAAWQREYFKLENLQQELVYWKEKLSGELPILELPYNYAKSHELTFEGNNQTIKLSSTNYSNLKELCHKEKLTLFMIMLAIFKILLMRYTGQRDIIIGTPILGRTQEQIQSLIGFFVNTLALRTQIPLESTFLEFLQQIRQTALESYDHANLPFEKLVQELSPERSLNRTPIFQVLFSVQNFYRNTIIKIPQLEILPFPLSSNTSKFDLSMFVEEYEKNINITLEYNTNLFNSDTISQILNHYNNILEYILQNPCCKISDVSCLSQNEYEKIVHEWNSTKQRQSTYNISELLETAKEKYPKNIALRTKKISLTYQEVHETSNSLAYKLLDIKRTSVSTQPFVAVYMERTLEMILAVLSIIKAGMAYLPMETSYPKTRIQWLLESLKIRYIITDTKNLSVLQNFIQELPNLEYIILIDNPSITDEKFCLENPLYNHKKNNFRYIFPQDWKEYPKTTPQVYIPQEAIAYIIFTSGSTGTPKGVMVNHQTVINTLNWVNEKFQVSTDDQLLWVTSLCFDLSVYDIFGILATGGTIRIANKSELQDPNQLAYILAYEPITFWDSAPAALQQILPFLPENCQQKLRLVFLSGDWIPVKMPESILKKFPLTKIISLGGATEATIWSNYYPIEKVETKWASIPYGWPISNSRYYILDEDMQPCPIGVSGNLYIGGNCLAIGYSNDPILTANKFFPDKFTTDPNARMYATGDYAKFWQDGTIEFLGRRDQQVKIRGFRIELAEVQSTLAQHPDIQDCAVIAHEENLHEKILIAYILPKKNVQAESNKIKISSSQIRIFLQELLPSYMIPSHFIFLEKLPVTSNGKLDRKALPLPQTTLSSISSESLSIELSTNPWEEIVSLTWKKFLPYTQLSIKSNFFEIGGHSLLAIQVIAYLQQILGLNIKVHHIFDYPILTDFARFLEKLQFRNENKLPAAIHHQDIKKPLPLSYGQERFWYLSNLESKNFAYNIPIAIRLKGLLQLNVLEQSLQQIILRQISLRTSIVVENNEQKQIVQELRNDFQLVRISFTHLPREEAEQNAYLQMINFFQKPFDFTQDILLRVRIWEIADKEYWALLVTHHIACDGSLPILLNELSINYQRILKDELYWPELPWHYRDFAAWQRQYFSEVELESQLQYWQEKLAKLPMLDIPTDAERPTVFSYHGNSLNFSFDLFKEMQHTCQNFGVTMFMLGMSAFQILLCHTTGQTDIAIGMPIQDRPQGFEDVIGCFVNTLVIRNQISYNFTLHQIVENMKKTILDAYQNKDVPLEMIIQKLNYHRDWSRTPLFQVMFSWQPNIFPEIKIPGITLQSLNFQPQRSRFDILLGMWQEKEKICGVIEYNSDIFQSHTIKQFLMNFETILSKICYDAYTQLCDLQIANSKLKEKNDKAYHNNSQKISISEAKKSYNTEETDKNIFPRDIIEWRLFEIWQSILPQKSFGLYDSFFNIGGDSLQIARLILKIQQEFKQSISLADFIQHNSITEVAEILRSKTSQNFESLIQIPSLEKSSKYPYIVAIPAAGGHCYSYLELVMLLKKYPFALLQCPTLNKQNKNSAEKFFYKNIEELAQQYWEILKNVPGPYILLGWSFGGCVAFEMAQQAKSENIHSVILLDSMPPENFYTPEIADPCQRLSKLARNFQISISPETLQSLSPTERIEKILSLGKTQQTLPNDITIEIAELWLQTFQYNEKIFFNYHPQPYTGKVYLLHTTDSKISKESNQQNEISKEKNILSGWKKYSSQLEIQEIGGDHFTLLKHPYVQNISTFFETKIFPL